MTVTINGTSGITTPGVNSTGSNVLGDNVADTLNVGNGAIVTDSSGNVGIGTSSFATGSKLAVQTASGKLDVRSYGGSSVKLSSSAALGYNSTGSNGHVWEIDDVQKMAIDSSGCVVIGTNTAASGVSGAGANMLTIKGPGQAATWGVGPSINYGNFYVVKSTGTGAYIADGGNSWTSYSDERIKTDLTPIENAVEKVLMLRSVTGRFINDEKGKSRSFLIAQDVDKVLPEAVDKSDEERWGVAYTDTIPLLVAAIKELKAELDATKAEVAALKGAA